MNLFQDLFDRQKRHFATGVTRSYAMAHRATRPHGPACRRRTRPRSSDAIARDFKTASQEQIFETRSHASARSRSRRASSRIGWRQPRRPCRERSRPPGIAALSTAILTAWR